MDCVKLRRCDAFTVLSVHAVIVLVVTHSCQGQSEVIGPAHPITALVGDDVILPCHLDPVMNAFKMTVEWARPDLDPRFALVWRDQGESEGLKHKSFSRRTSLFTEELKNGNVSLKLTDVTLSDNGVYKCFLPQLGKYSNVRLVVGAVSSPDVQVSNSSGRFSELQCESAGWYPEPDLSWLDSEGQILSAGSTETLKGPDGLYTVSSRLTVKDGTSFTCRVHQKDINQTRETLIHVPGDSSSSSSVSVTVIVLVLVLVILAVVSGVVWKWRQNKIQNKKNQKDEETQEVTECLIRIHPQTHHEDTEQRQVDRVQTVNEGREVQLLEGEGDTESEEKSNENRPAESDQNNDGGETETVRETDGGEPQSEEQTENMQQNTGEISQEEKQTENLQMEGGEGADVQILTEDTENEEKNNSPTGSDQDIDGGEHEGGSHMQLEKEREDDVVHPETEDTEQRQVDRVQTVDEGTEVQLSEQKADTESETKTPTGSDEDNDGGETETVRDGGEPQREEEQTENMNITGEDHEEVKPRELLEQKEKEKPQSKVKTKKEKELQQCERKISRLEENKQNQEKKIKELKQQLEETERKLQSENREDDEDERKKKEDLQNKIQKTERCLQRIQKDLSYMVERKLKAEKEKEENVTKTQPAENQSDEDEKKKEDELQNKMQKTSLQRTQREMSNTGKRKQKVEKGKEEIIRKLQRVENQSDEDEKEEELQNKIQMEEEGLQSTEIEMSNMEH